MASTSRIGCSRRARSSDSRFVRTTRFAASRRSLSALGLYTEGERVVVARRLDAEDEALRLAEATSMTPEEALPVLAPRAARRWCTPCESRKSLDARISRWAISFEQWGSAATFRPTR